MEENLTLQTTKNASWNFATNLVTKLGGLAFTIILARMLTPEFFGVYNLVLSVVIIALIFTDAGVNNTLLRYLSEYIDKNKALSRSYFRYLWKIKFVLVILVIIILALISKILAINIFQKPVILVPLLFSLIYIAALSFTNFFKSVFYSLKDLKGVFFLEILFELSKILFVFLMLYTLSNEFAVAGIFIALSFSFLLVFLLLSILLWKKKYIFFGKVYPVPRKRILHYLAPMTLVSISLTVLASVDTIMLGRFVNAEHIGYYRVALSMIFSITPFFAFTNVLLPVLTRVHGKTEIAFEKISRYLIMLTLPAALGVLIIARYFILAIYGGEYLPATPPLYSLAFLIIIYPLSNLYSIIFQSKEKTNILLKSVLITLVMNIFLNYTLIKYFLTISQEYAILGAGIATLSSNFFYALSLATMSKKQFKTKLPLKFFTKSLFAGAIMAAFLLYFQFYFDMNIYLGILEIILGAIIYFTILFLIKGITKQDFELIKSLIKK